MGFRWSAHDVKAPIKAPESIRPDQIVVSRCEIMGRGRVELPTPGFSVL
jgi:hypothetical protein